MKVSDLKPGTKVIFGRPKDLITEEGGEEAYLVAYGHFTQVQGPCGPVARPYTAQSRRDKRAIVARQTKRYSYDLDGYETVWVPWVTSVRNLMDPREYRVKADVVRKQERTRAQHRQAGEAIRATATPAIAKALGVPETWVKWYRSYQSRNDIRWVPRVDAPEDGVRKALGTRKLEALLKDVRAWEALPDPDECRL